MDNKVVANLGRIDRRDLRVLVPRAGRTEVYPLLHTSAIIARATRRLQALQLLRNVLLVSIRSPTQIPGIQSFH